VEERLLILNCLRDRALGGGEESLHENVAVPSLLSAIMTPEVRLAEGCLDLLHVFTSSSREILGDFLQACLLERLRAIRSRSALTAELCVDIAFAVLSQRHPYESKYLEEALELLAEQRVSPVDFALNDKVTSSILFLFHAGGDRARLISCSRVPEALASLMAVEDQQTAHVILGIIISLCRANPEVCCRL
jgi:hypothetical protein